MSSLKYFITTRTHDGRYQAMSQDFFLGLDGSSTTPRTEEYNRDSSHCSRSLMTRLVVDRGAYSYVYPSCTQELTHCVRTEILLVVDFIHSVIQRKDPTRVLAFLRHFWSSLSCQLPDSPQRWGSDTSKDTFLLGAPPQPMISS